MGILILMGIVVGFIIMMLGITLGVLSPHPHRHLVPFWVPEKLFLGGFLLLLVVFAFLF